MDKNKDQANGLLAEAKKYQQYKIPTTPLSVNGEFKPPPSGHAWTNYRFHVPTDEELNKWYSNLKVNGIGVILSRAILAIDHDGSQGDYVLQHKIVSQLSKENQKAFDETTRTRSPHGGHILFGLDEEAFPHGYKQIDINLDLKREGKHAQVLIMSPEKYIVEFGPGYSTIRGIEKLVTLSREQADEIFSIFELTKKEINGIRTIITSLSNYFKKGNRDQLVFALSGFLHKGGVPKRLIKDTVEFLIEFTDNNDDVPLALRLKVVEDTCAKDPNSDEVSGYGVLLEAVDDNQNVIDEITRIYQDLGYFKNSEKRSKTTNGYNIPIEIIENKLKHNVYAVIGENPLTLFIADDDDKKLKRAIIAAPSTRNQGSRRGSSKGNSSTTTTTTEDAGGGSDSSSGNNTTTTTTTTRTTLQYLVKDTIIDAIPVDVMINENPLDDRKTYSITFMHKASKKPFIVGPESVSNIINELQNKGRYIKDRESASQALQAILVEYEDRELGRTSHRVPYAGYFYVNNRIVAYDTTQQLSLNKEGMPLPIETFKELYKEEILLGIETFEELYSKCKDKNHLITSFKWGLISPFSYARKCMVSSGDWISGLHLYNRTQTGKSTKGKIIFATWRLLGTKYERMNFVGYQDTVPRFCFTIAQNTYPVIQNDCGEIANEKNKTSSELVEKHKHVVEFQFSRRKNENGPNRYIDQPALSNIMNTSNSAPPKDPAYRLRYLPIGYEKRLETTDEEKRIFNEWFETNYHRLGVFGDFTAQYIMNNPQLLKDFKWYELGQKILEEFYAVCGKEPPVWINALLLSNIIDETNETTYFEVRAFIMELIIDSYRKDPERIMDGDRYMVPQPKTLREKFDYCLARGGLIPCMHKKQDRATGETLIIITKDILSLLQQSRRGAAAGIASMESLADEIGKSFTSNAVRMPSKKGLVRAVFGKEEDFWEYLDSDIEAEMACCPPDTA